MKAGRLLIKQNTLVIICCLIVLSLVSGCRKKNSTTTYIPDQLKEYSVFQAGSYWVYRNETNSQIDSCYILTAPFHDYINLTEMEGGSILEFYCNVFGGSLIQETIISPTKNDVVFRNGFLGGDESPCLMSASFRAGFVDASIPYVFKNLEYFDSLSINNKMYYQVIHTQWKLTTTWSSDDTVTSEYFIAKSVGFIKLYQKQNTIGTTWSLLRYHVLQ